MWRIPEYVKIFYMPDVNFVIDIAKQRGGRVLEIGCGYGHLSLELARNGLEVDGVDISSESIAIASKYAGENPFKDNFGSLNYKVADIMKMDLKNEDYDSVVFMGTLHHIDKLDDILKKTHRCLKNEGNLILVEPVRDNFTMKSAEIAGILRAILPTWLSHEEKLSKLRSQEDYEKYINGIYTEYTYSGEYEQSPCDNSSSSESEIVRTVQKYFGVKKLDRYCAFIDRLIGGLRGENRYALARFLKMIDDQFVNKGILPNTKIRLWACKT